MPTLLPRAAYALGEILAASKPGVASSAAGVVADAQGHVDAIEQPPIAEVFEQIANFHARNAENIAATQAKADSLAQADAQARADAHVEALLRATEPDAPPPPPPLVRPADAVSERSTNAGR